MYRKVLCLIGFVLCFLLVSGNKLFADSQIKNYQWNKIDDYITGRDIYSVLYNGNEFIAVGQKGLIIRSLDGLNWSKNQIGYEEDFRKIELNGDKLVATTVSGRKFVKDNKNIVENNLDIIIDDEWILSTEKGEPIAQIPVSVPETHYISSFCKIYGYAEGQDIAVAVGESGNIFVGTKGSQETGNTKLTSDEDYSYYKNYLTRFGNSAILHMGNSLLYVNNNLVRRDIPEPFVQTINQQEITYIPADSVIKAYGGQVNYNYFTSEIELSLGKNRVRLTSNEKTASVNGKPVNLPYPAVLKNKQIYIPANVIELMGKKVFSYNNLIVISELEKVFNNESDDLILEALELIFSKPEYQMQSLSESVVSALVKFGVQQLEKGEAGTGKSYLETARAIEPNSKMYAVFIRSNRSSDPYYFEDSYHTQLSNETNEYFQLGLECNSENASLFTEMFYIYCDQYWFDKAEECLKTAISLSAGEDYTSLGSYLAECKGPNEAKKEITVSNYAELVDAIGSNRIIKVLPGNYSSPEDIWDVEKTGISSVKNLTITGVPGVGAKTINLKDCDSIFDFAYGYNISISNLEMNSLNFSNCSNVSINACNIYHGLKIEDVNNLLCTDSYIEGINDDGTYEDNMLEIHSSVKVEFDSCIMKGYSLRIGDSYYGSIGDINLKNCSLLNNAGICSTWSNYVPIKEDCGYEIFIGTEEWNEWRFLAAIKYIKNKGFDINYENTYDGNEEIYNDGKFLKLAEKLSILSNGSAFPSIDYIPGENEEWNAYYDYYGIPKNKKLNIIFQIEDLVNPDINNMTELIAQLKPLQKDITAYGWPVTVVLTDAENPYWSVAVADFSNKSFNKFLDSGESGNLKDYCNIIYTYESWGKEKHASDFLNIKPIYTEKEVSKQIEDLFLTKSLSVKPNQYYGQINSIDFTVMNAGGTFYITPVESFLGQGDFMHYKTDMIIKTDVITGQHYIAANDITYKIADEEIQKAYSKYKDQIFNQLEKDKRLETEEFKRVPCNDVLVFLESDNMDKELKFVFLTIVDRGSEDANDSEQYYCLYFVGTYEIDSQKVTDIKALDLVDFEEMLYKDK